MNGTHLMIDLETLGQRSSAVVLSVGAVLFDKHKVIAEKEWFFDADEQLAKGRTVDHSTIEWWMRQDDKARKSISNPNKISMGKFHVELLEFLKPTHSSLLKIWGNGSDFDISILSDMWKRHRNDFTTKMPWEFWNVRCFRTFNAVINCKNKISHDGLKHSAIDDARYQAKCVMAGLNEISN